MSERTYNNDEVAALLERATELQSQIRSQRKQQAGLTLDELVEIAADSGLDPAMLRQAASELEKPERPLFRSSEGTTKTHVIVERFIPGELSESVVEEVVMELRNRFDSAMGASLGMAYYGRGATEQIGKSVEWKHMSGMGVETRVLMRPRGEGFHMRLSQRVGMSSTKVESIMYGVILAFLASPAAFAFTKSPPVLVIAFLAALAVFIPLIAHLDTKWRQKKHQLLHDLGDDLAKLASGMQPEGTGEGGQNSETGEGSETVASEEEPARNGALHVDDLEGTPAAAPDRRRERS